MPEPEPQPAPAPEPQVENDDEDDCAIPDLDDSMQKAFSKIDEVTIKEEFIEEAPREDTPCIENEIDDGKDNEAQDAQDEENLENIFKNRNKRVSLGDRAPNQENIPPDFSTDKLFYHGYYEKNDGEGVGWNNEMTMFYKKSWGGEKFTVKDCISKMDRKFFEFIWKFSKAVPF